MEDIMEILPINGKGSMTNTLQRYHIQGVSGEIVNILGGGSMEYSE
jgi:hypothetical protein